MWHIMKIYSAQGINEFVACCGYIKELALLVQEVVGFKGEIMFDTAKPDGTTQKILQVNKMNTLGWHAKNTVIARHTTILYGLLRA